MPPQYDYRCVKCFHITTTHIRESLIWSCPICSNDETVPYEDRHQPMKRVYYAPYVPQMWHGHHDMTTGEYITDRKQIKESFNRASDERSERLGMEHRFIEVDPSDKKALGLTEEGLDSTHDAHVALGFKESKGNFVFPMSNSSPPEPKGPNP